MINFLNAEDLFALILKKSGQTTITIEFRQVNEWRYKLRLHGISTDLGRKEFETFCNNYPRNTCMTQTNIKIILNDTFTKYIIEERIAKYDKSDVDLLLNLWNETK